ncbi:MAG: polysaccharide biosynthesis protein [Defluviitaleaceae bacterium]|nr:polysaccharide biosynthesis protein [Defluviitaleaceae bacterium]
MKRKASESSFVKQAAILAAATLFVRFIGFLYRVPLTNLIGDEGNALYNAGFQFYSFLLVLSSAGLPAAIAKMVSERMARHEYRNAHRVFQAAMIVAVTFGFFGSVLLWFMAGYLSVWFGYPGSVYAIRAVSPAVLLVAIMAVFRGYFQGMNNTVPTAVSQVVEQFFNAIFKIGLAFLFIEQLELAAAGATAGTGIGAFLGLMTLLGIYRILSPKFVTRAKRDRSHKVEHTGDIVKEILSTAFPIIIGTAIYSMANFIDMAMVSHRLNSTGLFLQSEIDMLYGQLTGKFVVLTTLPVSISSALAIASLPSIAGSTATRDRKAVLSKISKATRLSMLVAIPSAVGLGVLAEPILLLLFPAHPDGAILLQVGAISIVFLSLVQVSTGALQGIGKIIFPVAGALAGATAKIPLNYVLIAIPEINVLGAVISTIVCYFFAMLINWGALKKYTKIKIDWSGTFIKPAIAAAMMGIASFVSHYSIMLFLGNNTIATLISVIFGVVTYFLILIILGGLQKEDVQRIPFVRKYVR